MDYTFKGLRRSIYAQGSLRNALAEELGLDEIEQVAVERESLDARRKPDIYRLYNLRFSVERVTPRLERLLADGQVRPHKERPLRAPEPTLRLDPEPLIVGFGPAGMFLGLDLARKGYRPIIFERGQAVPERAATVARLWRQGELDPECNLQFGAGGAGTWSDGKLSTGKSSPLDRHILRTFVRAGGPESILVQAKPHIGTDYFQRVVTAMAAEIESLGGQVHFGQRLEQIHLRDGAVDGLTVSGQRLATQQVVLAIGHSARDTVTMLHDIGVTMEPKPFAVGSRIEHPAAFINQAQYGSKAAQVLPPADYRLSYRAQGQAVYSFCMCPGGQVVCASSEPGGQVCNGMSRYARSAPYSNSALVVALAPQRLGWRSPLEAIAWQRELEARAFASGGGDQVAAGQRAVDLMAGGPSADLPETSYQPGVRPGDLTEVLPPFVVRALRGGLARFDRILPGFIEHGVLIGLESRTSSPVRILRDDTCQSVSTPGLFLLGEGAGYAGGIMTCARDAVRFAQRVIAR